MAPELYGMPGHSVRRPKWQSRLVRDCICCRWLAGRRDQQTAWCRRGRILILILIFIFGADIRTAWFLLA
jgi:hypothetical protein